MQKTDNGALKPLHISVCFCLVVWCFTSLLLIVMIMQRYAGEPQVSNIVINFLDEFLDESYTRSEGLYLFPRYFTSLKGKDPPEGATLDEYYTTEQDLFEQVFYSSVEHRYGYQVEPISNECVKVTLLNKNGDPTYPPIGFWYTVKGKRIDTWRIAKLQTLSNQDEEYGEG